MRLNVLLLKLIIMKALAELLGVLLQFVLSWSISLGLTFCLRLLIVVFSGIFGWIVGWFFGDTFLAILAQIGITGFSMWQIGAFLGFIGSFLLSGVNVDTTKRKNAEKRTF